MYAASNKDYEREIKKGYLTSYSIKESERSAQPLLHSQVTLLPVPHHLNLGQGAENYMQHLRRTF